VVEARRLIRLAQHYLKWMHLDDARCRFDVVAVTPRHDGRFEIRHIPAAFDASGSSRSSARLGRRGPAPRQPAVSGTITLP